MKQHVQHFNYPPPQPISPFFYFIIAPYTPLLQTTIQFSTKKRKNPGIINLKQIFKSSQKFK